VYNIYSGNKLLQLDNGIYCLGGICKNAGKTSFLNTLLSQNIYKPMGVLTTGRDGEERDTVFGNLKPSVHMPANTLFTTASPVLDELGSAIQVIDKLPYSAGKKQLWLVRSARALETEIVGPASAETQIKVAQLMQSHKAKIVFIDGSLDRKSIASHSQIDGVFLVVGSSFGSLDKIVTELTRLTALSQIPMYSTQDKDLSGMSISFYKDGSWKEAGIASLLGNETEFISLITELNPEKLFIPFAITDTVIHNLKKAILKLKDIVIGHPLQLHISKANLDYLLKEHQLYTLNAFKLKGIAVNSWAVDGHHLDSNLLRNKVRDICFPLPVFDIYEGA
jgi:hypothetical protein